MIGLNFNPRNQFFMNSFYLKLICNSLCVDWSLNEMLNFAKVIAKKVFIKTMRLKRL